MAEIHLVMPTTNGHVTSTDPDWTLDGELPGFDEEPEVEFAPDMPFVAERIVPSPTDPMAVARRFVAEGYTGRRGACYSATIETFYRYAGDHYPEDDEGPSIRALALPRNRRTYWKVVKKGEPPSSSPSGRKSITSRMSSRRSKAIGHLTGSAQPPLLGRWGQRRLLSPPVRSSRSRTES